MSKNREIKQNWLKTFAMSACAFRTNKFYWEITTLVIYSFISKLISQDFIIREQKKYY